MSCWSIIIVGASNCIMFTVSIQAMPGRYKHTETEQSDRSTQCEAPMSYIEDQWMEWSLCLYAIGLGKLLSTKWVCGGAQLDGTERGYGGAVMRVAQGKSMDEYIPIISQQHHDNHNAQKKNPHMGYLISFDYHTPILPSPLKQTIELHPPSLSLSLSFSLSSTTSIL